MSSVRNVIVSAAVAAAFAASAAAASPSSWAENQLVEMDAAGFGAPVETLTFEGVLRSNETRELPLNLGAGAYAFAALCGEDCEAITLDLAAPNGQRTGEHMTWVRAGLTAPGVYRLKVGVDRCPQTSCRYVVRVYRAAGS